MATGLQAAENEVNERVPLDTPFLEVYEGDFGSAPVGASGEEAPETPFLTELFVGDEVVSASSSTFAELVADLYDTEFDEVLQELVDEADAHAQLLGLDEVGADVGRVERALTQWVEPLRAETEALLDEMAQALEAADTEGMTTAELDQLLDRFEPQESAGGPVFEDFLKKVWNKAKAAAQGAVKLAKKGIAAVGKVLPLGIILGKLKALVRPLLTRVLKIALNRLPPALRPVAAQLAKRFLGVGELESDELDEGETEAPASADVRALQLEFDAEVSALLLAGAEPEMEALVAEAAVETERIDDASLAELDRAREAFVTGLMELRDGEDPTPLVEQFAPAVLGALRLGIRVIGRPKVVNFLAKFLGRLIQPYVGPQLTAPLSRAIVDAGLRLMTLETAEEEAEDETRVAAEAFAALVEDGLTRVAELDEDELDEEGIVEEVAFEGFRHAARAHFPARVLRGTGTRTGGVWIGMPRRGTRRYRKYSHVFDVTITPAAAARITTRGGRTLATFLRDRFSAAGPVRARVHIYQAIPGTRLARIVRAERSVPGLGPSARTAATELHPLTREAAGALLGQPELGEDVAEAYLDELAPAAVGHRFYFLEVAGGRPSATSASSALATGRGVARPRLSGTRVAVDLPKGQLRIAVFVAEAHAQDIAARLRRNEPIGAALSVLRPIYASGLRSVGLLSARRRVSIVGALPSVAAEDQLIRLPGRRGVGGSLGPVLTRWTRRAIASQLRGQRDAFIAAASAPQDGVTLVVTLAPGPALPAIARMIRGSRALGARDLHVLAGLTRSGEGTPKLEIVAGYRRA